MEPIICVSGTPEEQGITQGRALRDTIMENIAVTRQKLVQDGVDRAFYQDYIARNAKFMKERHPALVAEMAGIAQGAGLPFEDVLSLNIPAYFMTKYMKQECSMLLARGKATSDGNTYLIKNRDMSTYIRQAVIKRELPDVSIIEVNGAGTVTYPASGINSHGLAISTTGVWSEKAKPILDEIDAAHIFVNIRILLEQCKTVDEVLGNLKTYPRMNGLNIIAADRKRAVVIETTRDSMCIQEDDGSGVLYRTNHYLLDSVRDLNPTAEGYPSTYCRCERIGEMVSERLKKGKLRFQDLWRIMSDHENGTRCICRHPSEGFPAWSISTSMVVVEDLEAWTGLGNPCLNLRYGTLAEKG